MDKTTRRDFESKREMLTLGLAVLVGVIGGLGAALFRIMIDAVQMVLVELPKKHIFGDSWVLIVGAPAVGGLIVGTIVYLAAPEAKGHGVPEIIESVNLHGARMRWRVPFAKIIASAVTIGSGGSAGREGPIAQIGGGAASVIAEKMGLSREESRTLVVAGVSAGIAATFNAPLGGVLFGLEVIRRDQRVFSILPLVTSSVVGTAVGELILGKTPAFVFPADFGSVHFVDVPIFVVMGVLIGCLSFLWVRGFYLIEELIERIKIAPIALAGLGGLGVGLIELAFPEVNGISYDPIDDAFAIKFALQTLIVLAVMKMLATSFSIGSGGSGGVFAPTLFMGVMIGAAIGTLISDLGYDAVSIPVLALLGMAALFAASARAPLTAVVMTCEMVNEFSLVIPLMFAVVSAWIVAKQLHHEDIYILKLRKRHVEFATGVDVLEDILVSDIMVSDPAVAHPQDRIEHILAMMKEDGHNGYPVVKDGHVVGVITHHDIDVALDKVGVRDWIVSEVCTKEIVTIAQNCPVSVAFAVMARDKVNRLPVVQMHHSTKLVGWLCRSDIMQAYWHEKSSRISAEYSDALFDNIIIEQTQEETTTGNDSASSE